MSCLLIFPDENVANFYKNYQRSKSLTHVANDSSESVTPVAMSILFQCLKVSLHLESIAIFFYLFFIFLWESVYTNIDADRSVDVCIVITMLVTHSHGGMRGLVSIIYRKMLPYNWCYINTQKVIIFFVSEKPKICLSFGNEQRIIDLYSFNYSHLE